MNSSRTKKTVINTAIGLLYLVVHTLYSFVLTSIIIRYFGSESNGLISSIKQILTYASLVDLGLGAACIMSYYGPLSRNNKEEVKNLYLKSRRFFRTVGGLYFGILIVLSFLYPLIVDIEYSKSYITFVFLAIGFSRGFSYFAIEKYRCVFTADQKNWIEQLCLLLTDIIAIMLVLVFLKIGIIDSILKIELLIAGLAIIQYLYYNIIFRKCYSWIFSKDIIPAGEKHPIKQVKATFIHMISSTVSYNTDMILLTIFRTLYEVSIYSVYSMVFAIANSFFSAFTKGIESSFGNLYHKDRKQFSALFDTYEYGYIILDTIILCIVILILEPFIQLYTKAETVISYWDFNVAITFVAITFFNNIRNPHAMAIRVSENYKSTQNIFVMEAIINLFISLLLVRSLGILGVLFGTLASVVIRNAYVINFIYKKVLDKSVMNMVKKASINCIPLLICSYFALNPIIGPCTNYLALIGQLIIYSISVFALVIVINLLFNYRKFKDLLLSGASMTRQLLHPQRK